MPLVQVEPKEDSSGRKLTQEPKLTEKIDKNEKNIKQDAPQKRLEHFISLGPRSYYSNIIPQTYDQKLITVSRYKVEKNSEDELMQYTFDGGNFLLMRRGKRTLKVYLFQKPELMVSPKKKDFTWKDLKVFNRKEAHKCKNQFSYTIKYQKDNIKTQETNFRKIILCYAPELEISSHFKNIEKKQKDDSQFSYPTNFILKQDISTYQLGSFIDLNMQERKQEVTDKPQDIIGRVSYGHQSSKKYGIKIESTKISFLSGFRIKSEDGSTELYLIVGTPEGNYLYQGNYHSEYSQDNLKMLQIPDFRQFIGLSSMESGRVFTQIEDLSYIMQLKKIKGKTSKPTKNKLIQKTRTNQIMPWEGTNGVCRQFVQIRHNKLGNTIVCYKSNKFYMKYILEESTTITQEVYLSTELETIFSYTDFIFLYMKTSEQLQQHFVIFYRLGTTDNKLRAMFVQLFGDVYPVVLLINDIVIDTKLHRINRIETQPNFDVLNEAFIYFGIDEILDIQIAGRKIIFAVAHKQKSKYTQSDHFFRIFLIQQNLNLVMIRHSSLPLSRLSFATGAKIIISSVETKLDTEALSQLDRGDVKFFLGFKVVKTKVTKDPYTGIAKNFNELNFLILSIEHTSLTSMTLVRLEQGEDLIDFGPYYLEESNTKETHFVVLTKAKRGGQD